MCWQTAAGSNLGNAITAQRGLLLLILLLLLMLSRLLRHYDSGPDGYHHGPDGHDDRGPEGYGHPGDDGYGHGGDGYGQEPHYEHQSEDYYKALKLTLQEERIKNVNRSATCNGASTWTYV